MRTDCCVSFMRTVYCCVSNETFTVKGASSRKRTLFIQDGETWRRPTDSEFIAIHNQELAERMCAEDIIWCQTAVVEALDPVPHADSWWLVSDWLAEKLKKLGHVVYEDHGCHWWGRTSDAAPNIITDGVLQDVADLVLQEIEEQDMAADK